jgi:hypothetical protein
MLAAAYLYVVAPLVTAYRDADEEIQTTRDLIARYESIATTRQTYQDQRVELSSRQVGSGVYLLAESDALASAELQGRIRDTVATHGGTLRSIQTLQTGPLFFWTISMCEIAAPGVARNWKTPIRT